MDRSKKRLSGLALLLSLSVFHTSCFIGTSNTTDSPYSALARSEMLHLNHPGYVVGLEKRPRRDVGVEFSGADPQYFENQTPPSSNFRVLTNDPEIPFVTHLVRFTGGDRRGEHCWGHHENIYQIKEQQPDLSYDNTSKALRSLEEDLRARLGTGKYSHIIFTARGWNNDQHESIRAFNEWFKTLGAAADRQGYRFEPLVVCITWPSAWGTRANSRLKQGSGHILSYFTRGNDADEIGYTTGNLILNGIIRPARDAKAPQAKIICLGHSFGARIVATAVTSAPYLKPELRGGASKVDLYLGLEPAFSINRFVSHHGLENADYTMAADVSKLFVVTSSDCDSANPAARFITHVRHVGGRYGLDRGKEYTDAIATASWMPERKCKKDRPPITDGKRGPYNTTESGKVRLIDATNIVGGHNDVEDAEMADLMMTFIREVD